jgi:hypothetical protein
MKSRAVRLLVGLGVLAALGGSALAQPVKTAASGTGATNPAATAPASASTSAVPEAGAPVEAPQEALGDVGESCRARSDCADGLKCVDKTCRDQFEGTSCESRRDCGPRLGCFSNVCAASADAVAPRGGAASDREPPEEPTNADKGVKERSRRDKSSGRGLIAGGAVLTAVGWAGVLVGVPVMILGALGAGNDNAYMIAGGVGVGVGGALGITGSVMLGVGVRQRRESRYLERDETGFLEPAFAPTPGLTLTFPMQ